MTAKTKDGRNSTQKKSEGASQPCRPPPPRVPLAYQPCTQIIQTARSFWKRQPVLAEAHPAEFPFGCI